MKQDLAALRQQFVEAAGHATQTFGFGRIIGQIYAHAYFTPQPLSLDDLARDLGISKGSASMAVRQLETWGALRKLWVKGDRKDYYEPTEEFGKIIRKALVDLVGQSMESADSLISQTEAQLQQLPSSESVDAEIAFFRKRVAKIDWFRKRAQGLWESPVIRMLFK